MQSEIINPGSAFAGYFSDRRIRPYLAMLANEMAAGNVCLDLSAYPERERALEDLRQSELCAAQGDRHPFILDGERLYLQRYYQYESDFIADINRLTSNENMTEKRAIAQQNTALIHQLFPVYNLQAIAALSAFVHRLQIITGGPGTGKTTSIAKFLALALSLQPTLRIMLAAPTGKAAVRMLESLQNIDAAFAREKINVNPEIISTIKNLQPMTLHRLLGYIPDSIWFKHRRDNPLPADIVIIDECSMIDMAMFAKLLAAIGPQTQLILLGDKNQLASVEAGSVFGDLCGVAGVANRFTPAAINFFSQFFPAVELTALPDRELLNPVHDHIVELQESHRFSNESGIGKLAKLILHGAELQLSEFTENKDEAVKMKAALEDVDLQLFAQHFVEMINEKDIIRALKLLNKAKILCAVREGKTGVYQLNQAVEKYLGSLGVISPGSEYYENRLIMVTGNQPELDIYNGDTGLMRMIDGKMRACFLSSTGTLVKLPPAMINGLETAWAMTIHKSQGSEFDHVLIVLPTAEENPLLTRELIYTAVTRAKKTVFITGDENVLAKAVKNTAQRISGIPVRLNTSA